MIKSIEARLPDGRHFAICEHPREEGSYIFISSQNPNQGTYMVNPLLHVIFTQDMLIEQRQNLAVMFANQIGAR